MLNHRAHPQSLCEDGRWVAPSRGEQTRRAQRRYYERAGLCSDGLSRSPARPKALPTTNALGSWWRLEPLPGAPKGATTNALGAPLLLGGIADRAYNWRESHDQGPVRAAFLHHGCVLDGGGRPPAPTAGPRHAARRPCRSGGLLSGLCHVHALRKAVSPAGGCQTASGSASRSSGRPSYSRRPRFGSWAWSAPSGHWSHSPDCSGSWGD